MNKNTLLRHIQLHNLWLQELTGGTRATLRCEDLSCLTLPEINLQGADLYQANFRWSQLRGSRFVNADLQYADFRRADLTGVDFTGANLTGATFSGANLTDVNMYKCRMSPKIVNRSRKPPIEYTGRDYRCLCVGSIIKIGCQVRYRKDWKKLTENDARRLDGHRALQFWNNERDEILRLSRKCERSCKPKPEIKAWD